MVVGGVTVTVVRKAIKTVRLAVYPPDGRVRVSAPQRLSDDAVRKVVAGKLDWIRKQQARLAGQPPAAPRRMVSGETVAYLGRSYALRVVEAPGRSQAALTGDGALELRVPPGSSREARRAVLDRWYRQRLGELVPPLLARWEARLAVRAAEWRLRRMRTRWGSCSITARRIWLNVALAQRPVESLEYVIVHELAHLIERGHGPRFKAVLDRAMPGWREVKRRLDGRGVGG